MLLFCLMIGGGAFAAPVTNGLYATLQTTMGDVCFELYYTNVPQTVANFVSLAEGTRPWVDPRSSFVSKNPYYNGTIFHRVIDRFMIQGGSPKGDGSDGPGYSFEDEFDPSLRHDAPGVVSMANSGFDSNGGQFFITVTNTPHLDDVHSVFGRVVEGMQVVYDISQVTTNAQSRPLVDVVVTNTFITRNGIDAQSFVVTNQALPEVEALPLSIRVSNGLELIATSATSSYQFVYYSTNLTDWETAASEYLDEPTEDWTLSGPIGTQAFFHANRVVYTPDADMTADVTNHKMVMSFGTNTYAVTVDTPNSGHISRNADPQPSAAYLSWTFPAPYYGQLFVQSAGYPPYIFQLHYSSLGEGRCVGFFHDGFGWDDLESGTFTDTAE